MKTIHCIIILPTIMLLMMAIPCSGQPPTNAPVSLLNSDDFFFYIEYCGSRYNKSTDRQELVINAIKLPIGVLKKIPHLKNDGQYSSRNCKIYQKQQKIIKRFQGEKMIVRINKYKYKAFYPNGLKKGCIIEISEFNQWNFLEKPIPALPPVKKKGNYDLWWYWNETDPLNIKYGLMLVPS
ncbi:MAG: hypothetical protein ACOYN5_01375 [Bacteroidales bacterium]